jgi:hypothetical protein
MKTNNPFGPKNDATTLLPLKMAIIDRLGEISKLFNDSKKSGYKLDPTYTINFFDILKDEYGLNQEIDLVDNDTLYHYIQGLDIDKLNNLHKYLDDTYQRLHNFPINESSKMKNKKINTALLSEELKRFKSLTDYNYYGDKNTISENFPIVSMEDDRRREPNVILGNAMSEADETELSDDNLEATTDAEVNDETSEDLPDNTPVDDTALDIPVEEVPVAEVPAVEVPTEEPAGDEIELDVTELVKGSEAAKQSADSANSKIEQLIGMVDKLESQLSGMDTISNKIEDLEKEIERRNPTPIEQLEMRSLDSFPYSVKLSDFWSDKSDRYDTGDKPEEPKEYVLTQQDVDDDYSETSVEDSFNGDNEEDEGNF